MREALDLLLTRRSVKAADLTAPGPTPEQIDVLISAAARVPDHGKMFPWHFMIFEGDAQTQAGAEIARLFRRKNPEAPAEAVALEQNRFRRAPMVIGVVSRLRPGKHPRWEQYLSAGAACQNLCLAANALGFGTNWLTEWYAYDPAFREFLGLDARDNVAGFIHIGTPAKKPEERDRPDLTRIVTCWRPGTALNKGDSYDKAAFPFPEAGFTSPASESEKR